MWRIAFSTRCRNEDVKPINDRIVTGSLVILGTGDLNPLPTFQVQVCLWLSEHHPSEGPGSEGLSKDPDVADFDLYAAEVKTKAIGIFLT